MTQGFLAKNPSVLFFLAILTLFSLLVTTLTESDGIGFISTSFIKTPDKTLCLCLVALALDLIGAMRASCRWATWRSLLSAATRPASG